MKLYTLEEAKALSREDAEAAISAAVYAATRLIETLENAVRKSKEFREWLKQKINLKNTH